MRLFLLLFLLVIQYTCTMEATERGAFSEQQKFPIFVSLGSSCEVGIQLRNCHLRTAAFPFDWVMSLDHPRVIDCLQQDFKYFMNENYLVPHPGYVHNTAYNIAFVHDWTLKN
ncbi:MAG TPA: DUF1796 family putative cysteine peptidase, partial [Chlamydiales bacterium]|nr:DUF1796 family putative cysteine peptidase [Chlamydiales bacterium]